MKKKILFIDKKFAKDNKISSEYFILLPDYKDNVKWSIEFEKQKLFNAEIIKLRNRIATLFAKKIYSKKINYKIDSCEALFLGSGGLITFVIADRLLRLNKLFGHIDKNNLVLPEVEYLHDNSISYGEFFYNIVEQSPVFNQWIVNTLLPSIKKKKGVILNKSHIDIDFYHRKSVNNSFLIDLKKYILNNLLSSNFSFMEKMVLLLNSFFMRLKKILFKLLRFFFIKSAPLIMDSSEHTVSSKLCNIESIWPLGTFSVLNKRKLNGANSDNVTINRESIRALSGELSNMFKDFLSSCGEAIYLDDDTFEMISLIYSILMPKVFVEDIGYYCKDTIKDFSNLKAKTYFCNGTLYSHESTLNIFACRETNKKVIASQHSAWGGYLSNGSLVSEVLIKGCDDYVTFGWNNKADDGTSVWRGSAIPMPSPMLSEIHIKNKNKMISMKTENSKSVLLCLGFIYRFPSIYNSFLRWDNINKWTDIISDILLKLANDDIKVTIAMYNNPVAKTLSHVLSDFESIHPNIEVLKDHDPRIRHLLSSAEFDDNYCAVIWDMPAGGFTESIASGKKTFALWNENIILNQNSSQSFINNLLAQSIFFSNGDQLRDAINHTLKDSSWYDEIDRKNAVNDFMSTYARIDPDWKNEWKKLLKSLSK